MSSIDAVEQRLTSLNMDATHEPRLRPLTNRRYTGYPQLRSLRLTLSTELLEKFNLSVWANDLSTTQIHACETLALVAKRRGLKSFNVDFRQEKSFNASRDMQLRCKSNLTLIRSTLVKIHATSQAEERTEGTPVTKVDRQDEYDVVSTSTTKPVVLLTASLRSREGSMLDFVKSHPEEAASWLENVKQSPQWYSSIVDRAT